MTQHHITLDITGTYEEVRDTLQDKLWSLRPDDDDLGEMQQQVWDGLIDEFRKHVDEVLEQYPRERDEIDSVDALVAEIHHINLTSNEWENGWFPSSADFVDATGREVGWDSCDVDPDLYQALRELSRQGYCFDPRWSYTLERPSTKQRQEN